jgi:plasmid maintenance system antidote protein VapI
MRMFDPPHPGVMLREYLGKVMVADAARHRGVARAALSRILNGRAGASAPKTAAIESRPGGAFWCIVRSSEELDHRVLLCGPRGL